MSDVKVELICPKCAWKIITEVKECVPGRIKICPQCKAHLRFSYEDDRKIQQELDKFERNLKLHNRNFRRLGR